MKAHIIMTNEQISQMNIQFNLLMNTNNDDYNFVSANRLAKTFRMWGLWDDWTNESLLYEYEQGGDDRYN
jgi:hypothetical protein